MYNKINKTRDKITKLEIKGGIATDTENNKLRIIRTYFKNMCFTKLENLKEMFNFHNLYYLPNINQYQINSLNRSKKLSVPSKVQS